MNEYIQTSGLTPIGTIIHFMGTKTPDGYLFCDGSTYNITDYSEFCEFLIDQFGSVNHFGGDGVDTFGVPDLRESVLVGSGQNDTQAIAAHDVFDVGEFKDDSFQDHSHIAYAPPHDRNDSASQGYPLNNRHNTFRSTDRGASYQIVQLLGARALSGVASRNSTVTRTKETGVLCCIKVK